MKIFRLGLILLVFLCASCAPKQKNIENTSVPFFGEEGGGVVIVKITRVGHTRCGGYYEEGFVQSRALSLEDARAFLEKVKKENKILKKTEDTVIYEDSSKDLFKVSLGEGVSFPCGEAEPTNHSAY